MFLPPFPIAFMTWRESVVGFQPKEMVYMQVEKNWVAFAPPGYAGASSGYAVGRNLGSVKWSMQERTLEGRRCRMLHSENRELKTGILRIEEVFVDPATNEIVAQNEQRTSLAGNERSEAVFFPDHIELRRTGIDGKVRQAEMHPDAGGMAAFQRRFVPLGKEPKEFVVLDGLAGTFRKMKVEATGRFHGTWTTEKYDGTAYRFTAEGMDHTVLMTDEGEIVQVTFMKDTTLALTSATKSRRKVPQPTGTSGR